MGKGSSARPFGISKDEYHDRFELIFGKKNRNANDTTTARQDNNTGATDTGPSNTTSADSNKPCGTAENDIATANAN